MQQTSVILTPEGNGSNRIRQECRNARSDPASEEPPATLSVGGAESVAYATSLPQAFALCPPASHSSTMILSVIAWRIGLATSDCLVDDQTTL